MTSEYFDLYLCEINGDGVGEHMASTDVQLYTDEIYRRPTVHLYGTQQSPALSIELTFACEYILDATRQSAVFRWLFGHQSYKKLQIVQCDFQDVYYNCILTNPTVTSYGNYPYAIHCTMVCDSPFAWENPHTLSFENIAGIRKIEVENMTDNNWYTFPIIKTKLTTNATQFSITNNTDNNSTMSFANLLAGEELEIDCGKGLITGSSGLLRFDNFQGTFFRLLPNVNNITINGYLDYLTITFANARKVSA